MKEAFALYLTDRAHPIISPPPIKTHCEYSIKMIQDRLMMEKKFPPHMFKAILSKALSLSVLILIFAYNVWAQAATVNSSVRPQDKGLVPPQPAPAPVDYTWWYVTLGVLAVILVAAVIFWVRARISQPTLSKVKNSGSSRDSWESDALDGDKEMEWLRKHNNTINRKRVKKPSGKPVGKEKAPPKNGAAAKAEPVILTKEIQLSGAGDLPFNSILRLEYPHNFDQLPVSQEESLLEAIEQVLDEFNEDEEIKELSMRIIAAYKTRNSVDALSQVALYDLSANTRCKAIEILGEFDHESVFEPIILACADPTREVRAAAARVLTRLGFHRADCWARVALLDEEGRMRQIARAAIEGGLVDRYFDRLTHSDYKQAYEAFALFTLLLKARETTPVATALESHPSQMVKIAIIHVVKVNKEYDALPYLLKLAERKDLPKEVWEYLEEAIARLSRATEETEEELEVVYQAGNDQVENLRV
jgi:hypothetical protein